MAGTLEFYFDYGSPYSYLADTQVGAIASRSGAALVRKPMLLGGVFKATGNHSPAELPAKSKWSSFDMPLWARHYGVPFQRNPFFPVNTLALMRGAIAAHSLGVFERYVEEMYRHMWIDHKKMDDPAVYIAALKESGFDADKILETAGLPAVKAELIANTERAVARGAFGSPTFFVGDEMWFGKDRLRDVEEAIAAKPAVAG